MCTTTECYVITGIFVGLFLLLVTWFAWRYPIKDNNGVPQQVLSVALAILLFPIYALIYAFQNPLQTNGVDQPFLTLFLAFIFWPIIFFIPLLNGKADETASAKVADSNGDWV